MKEIQREEKIPRVAIWAIFCGAILVGAAISIAALSTPAYAAQNAYRYPPYSPGKSVPNNTCEDMLYWDRCAAHSNSNGQARVYVFSVYNGWIISQVEHNLNPPQSNPSITVTTPNFVDVKYTNSARGKFYVADSNNNAFAILRVGGWTTVLRQADQTWIKDKVFYTEYSGLNLADGEYVIPYTNFKTTLSKNNNPGKYGVGTYFEARVYGDYGSVSTGKIDAWNYPRELYSDRLAVECALCP